MTPEEMAANAQAAAMNAVNGQRQFIIDSFRGQVYISDQLDVQDTPLYDTITYTAGQTITTPNSQFFVNVGSQSGKSFVQTNLTKSGQLNAPEAFSVFGIRLYWDPSVLRVDLNNIIANSATAGFVFEFWLNQKYYQRAPLWHFASGAGIDGYTTNTGESFYTNGTPDRNSMHVLQIPLVIGNQVTFFGQLVGANYTLNASGVGIFVVCELVGLYARAVQ